MSEALTMCLACFSGFISRKKYNEDSFTFKHRVLYDINFSSADLQKV